MSSSAPTNRLLDSLDVEVRAAVISQCEHVAMPLRYALFDAYQQPRYVHFPTSGIASVVTTMRGGEAVEVGLTGREGLGEKYHLLGPQSGMAACFMQLPGTGFRMSFKRF